MVNCAKCNGVLCCEDNMLDMIDNDMGEKCGDGSYYFEMKCDKCNCTNNVHVTTKMRISHVETGIMWWG